MLKELFNENVVDNCCIIVSDSPKPKYAFDENLLVCINILGNIKDDLEDAINDDYVNFLICVDTLFELNIAERILELKQKYPHIKLICLLGNCPRNLTKSQILRYQKVKKDADKSIFFERDDGAEGKEIKYKLLIDNSSKVITFEWGDYIVYKSLMYAKRKRLHIKYVKLNNDNICIF